MLPTSFNTPDGADLDRAGNVILCVPNFSNEYLLETGEISEPSPAVMAMIDREGVVSTWYAFTSEDLHSDTGEIGPMDCAFGPDGNLYVADMQALWDGGDKSRVLRINVVDGVARDMDVVVEGLVIANGLAWKGETLFVTESALAISDEIAEGESRRRLQSAVYAFTLKELAHGPVSLKPYRSDERERHLLVTLESGNSVGLGADGLALDDLGNLYISVIENGRIYKTTFDGEGRPLSTTLFARAPFMRSCDGIAFNPRDKLLYVADPLSNAIHRVDRKGRVSTLHQNGDTDGSDGALDQPVDVLLRGSQLIVVNMDVAWLLPPPLSRNTRTDEPYTLSVIELD